MQSVHYKRAEGMSSRSSLRPTVFCFGHKLLKHFHPTQPNSYPSKTGA